MNGKHKIVLYTILSLSLFINVVTLSLDTYPYLYPKLKEKYFREKTISIIDKNTEQIILNQSMEMAKSSKVAKIWNEPKGVTNSLLSLHKGRASSEFQTYNFPRDFLLYGISEYLIKNKYHVRLKDFKLIFDKLLVDEGEPNFSINRIDQIPFGLTALNLYKEFNEGKYLLFSDRLYKYVIQSVEEEGIISYRQGQPIIYEDMLGMVVPFLIKYNHIKGEKEAIKIAKNQLSYYINYGVDKETFLPTHAINRREKIKIGPTNWGRGIGWYFIALSNYHKKEGEFKNQYDGLMSTLMSLRNSENLWSQFPGGNDVFDASATTMILYSIILNNSPLYNKKDVLNSLKDYISEDGVILHTSGDTYGLNRYSNTFGKSELSQGMLLLILSLLVN